MSTHIAAMPASVSIRPKARERRGRKEEGKGMRMCGRVGRRVEEEEDGFFWEEEGEEEEVGGRRRRVVSSSI